MDHAGIVLAAGAGRRMGIPKSLVRTPEGDPWSARAARLLLEGGCSRVVVVLGARAEEALRLVPTDERVGALVVAGWEEGLSTSLRAGLRWVERLSPAPVTAVVTLVDLPGLTPEVVRRLTDGADGRSLRQAAYDGRPGHPVVVGRTHWAALGRTLRGDEGGRRYLRAHEAERVECGGWPTAAMWTRRRTGSRAPRSDGVVFVIVSGPLLCDDASDSVQPLSRWKPGRDRSSQRFYASETIGPRASATSGGLG
ncbi:nucleotidyltransferase family protein [Leifsonia sp. P73]|uniref:nucleotidyltransferase family protein n=1 Tax=Leifsonia sp. P73 TaxID=3423959 RepID=UPI003DA2315E